MSHGCYYSPVRLQVHRTFAPGLGRIERMLLSPRWLGLQVSPELAAAAKSVDGRGPGAENPHFFGFRGKDVSCRVLDSLSDT